MRKILSLLSLLCFWVAVNAQSGNQVSFEKGFGTAGNDEAYAMCKTVDGGCVLAGRSNGFGTNYDVYIVKFDSLGNVVWYTNRPVLVDDVAYAVQEASNGDLLVAGNARTFGTAVGSDIFLLRYDASGNFLWQQQFGLSTVDESCTEMLALPNGNIMLVGRVKNGATYDGQILITDGMGDLLSAKVYGIDGDESFTDAVLSIDNKVLLCSRSGLGVYRNVWLLKTDFNGDTLWTKRYPTTMPNVDVATLTQTNNGTIALVGSEYYNASSQRSFYIAADSTGVEITRASSGLVYDTPTDAVVMSGGGFVYGSSYINTFNHFGMQMCDLIGGSPGYWRHLETTVYEGGSYQSGFAYAMCSDSMTYWPDNIYWLAGSTRLSGFGQSDFALVRSVNGHTKSQLNAPVITAPNMYSGGSALVDIVDICKGDSVQLTLVSNKNAMQHWFRTSTADVNLSTDTTLWVKTSGMYLLVAQDADSNIWTSNFIKVNVQDTAISAVTASGPLNFCAAQGNSLSLSVAQSINASFQWYLNGNALTGQTSPSINVAQSGSYYCVMSNTCVIDTSSVSATNIAAPPDTGWGWGTGGVFLVHNLCDPAYTMSLTIPPNPGSTIQWYKDSVLVQSGGTSYQAQDTGYFWVVMSNACGTNQLGPIHGIHSRSDQPIVIAGNSAFCEGYGSATLQVQSQYNNPVPPFQWYRNGSPVPGATNSTYFATLAGNYTVEYNDPICIFPQFSLPINIGLPHPTTPNPFIISATDTLICGDTVYLTAPFVPVIYNSQYRWMVNNSWVGSGPTLMRTGSQAGTYRLVIYNACGDSVAASQNTITISNYPQTPTLTQSANVLCQLHDSVELSITNYNPNYQYEWRHQQASGPVIGTDSSIWVSQSGAYFCRSLVGACSAGFGLEFVRDTLLFGFIVNPISCDSLCSGSIDLNPAGLPPYYSTWSHGVAGFGTDSLTNLCPGSYSALVVDSAGCSGSFSYVISQTLPVVATYSVVPPSPGLCDGQLTVNTTGGLPPFLVNVTPPLNPGLCDSTMYTISVVDSNGCQWQDTYLTYSDNDSVWPGDANYDGVANNFDVLALGLAYGKNGPVRANANLSWTPQFALDWSDKIFGSLDVKHVDTNGDGVINISDTAAILQNYGATHQRLIESGSGIAPDVFVLLDDDSLGRNEPDTAEIHIGDAISGVSNLYGVAYTIAYDTALVQSSSVQVEAVDSWFADPDVNAIIFTTTYLPLTGVVEVAMSRTNLTPRSGAGMVARLIYRTAANVPQAVNPSAWQVANVLAYDHNGIQMVMGGDSTPYAVYNVSTGIGDLQSASMWRLEPNPNSGMVRVVSSGIDRYIIRNLVGQAVKEDRIHSTREYLDLSLMSDGVYLFEGYQGTQKAGIMKMVLSRY